MPWHCILFSDIHCWFRSVCVSEFVCIMPTLLTCHYTHRTHSLPCCTTRELQESHYFVCIRDTQYLHARVHTQHSYFLLSTNIHRGFTFFCKNISTDLHSGMSRSPWLQLRSHVVTELRTEVEGYAHSSTDIFSFFHPRDSIHVYVLSPC